MLVTFNSKAKRTNKKDEGGRMAGGDDIVVLGPPRRNGKGDGKVGKPVVESRGALKMDEKAAKSESGTIRIIEDARDFHKMKASRRSKQGCLTCKIRKKKCNETRPVCADCARLNKECVWVDYSTMSDEQIRVLRERVEHEESVLKLRKRKARDSSTEMARTSYDPTPLETNHQDTQMTYACATQKLQESYTKMSEHGVLKTPSLLKLFRVFNSTPSPSSNSPAPTISSLQQAFVTPNSPTISNLMNPLDHENGKHIPTNDVVDLPNLGSYESNPYDKVAYSPSAFLNFLRGLNQPPDNTKQDENSYAFPLLGDQHDKSKESSITQSPNFSILNILEQFSGDRQLSPSNFNNFASSLNSIFTPLPPSPPSIIPELTGKSAYLYNYYVETLSRKVCIAPSSQNDSNSYQNIFLPLAHKDKGVLYGILAWSGFHLDGDWINEGKKYADLALEHMNKTLKESMDRNQGKDDRHAILVKLATLLILCGAEICRGDVKNWSIYLYWGWKILFTNGGILNFNLTKEEHWLISNFAYHDLLASSSSERGTYFPSEDYETIFSDHAGLSQGNLNPLLGVSKKLYRIIGDISTLAFESKIILSQYYNRDSINAKTGISESPIFGTPKDINDNDSDLSIHARMNRLLSSVIDKAIILQMEIDESKPDLTDLVNLTDEELEWQLTLFEAFQISAKLFLRQTIMKCNPSSLESQILANDLIKCIDIVLGSPVQASLVFPMFMSGIHCVTTYDRDTMRQRLDQFMKLYGPWNVTRAKFLMEKVWEQSPEGDRVVDWHSILKDLGWDINFA